MAPIDLLHQMEAEIAAWPDSRTIAPDDDSLYSSVAPLLPEEVAAALDAIVKAVPQPDTRRKRLTVLALIMHLLRRCGPDKSKQFQKLKALVVGATRDNPIPDDIQSSVIESFTATVPERWYVNGQPV